MPVAAGEPSAADGSRPLATARGRVMIECETAWELQQRKSGFLELLERTVWGSRGSGGGGGKCDMGATQGGSEQSVRRATPPQRWLRRPRQRAAGTAAGPRWRAGKVRKGGGVTLIVRSETYEPHLFSVRPLVRVSEGNLTATPGRVAFVELSSPPSAPRLRSLAPLRRSGVRISSLATCPARPASPDGPPICRALGGHISSSLPAPCIHQIAPPDRNPLLFLPCLLALVFASPRLALQPVRPSNPPGPSPRTRPPPSTRGPQPRLPTSSATRARARGPRRERKRSSSLADPFRASSLCSR